MKQSIISPLFRNLLLFWVLLSIVLSPASGGAAQCGLHSYR